MDVDELPGGRHDERVQRPEPRRGSMNPRAPGTEIADWPVLTPGSARSLLKYGQ